MLNQNPKNIIKNFRNRNVAIGKERRLNTVKTVLEHQPHFPKTLEYEDIDTEMVKWLSEDFDITYDGKKLNTYKLFSNQRISEYGQTWQNLDEKGNLDINFKTLTREPNPQKGDNQGGYYNIPMEISFPLFSVRTVDENGIEYTESYSMKQPIAVNLIYTIGVFTNSYKIINKMNVLVHKQFKGLEKYIFPNGYPIPLELNSISDESEYTIDDRKYYSQTYQIKAMAYVITEDDFIVTKTPSRVKATFTSGMNSSRRKKKEKFDIQSLLLHQPKTVISGDTCNQTTFIDNTDTELPKDVIMNSPISDIGIEIEEMCGKQKCWEDTDDEFYVNRKIQLLMRLNYCQSECEYKSEYHLGVESMTLKNIKSYSFTINGIEINLQDSDVDILPGDVVKLSVEVIDEKEVAVVDIMCFDLDSVVEKEETASPTIVQI